LIFDFFKRKKPRDSESVTMDTIVRGCIFEFQGETWQVRAIHEYEWEGGGKTREYECAHATDCIFVEKDEDETDSWLVTRRKPASELDSMVIEMIIERGKPPVSVQHGGVSYRLVEESAAYFKSNGEGDEKPLVVFDYEDSAETLSLSIEQWGEREFQLAIGEYVEEFRFANILPAP
jgi:hypothetical protein